MAVLDVTYDRRVPQTQLLGLWSCSAPCSYNSNNRRRVPLQLINFNLEYIKLVDTMSKHRSHEICRKISLWPRQLWTHIWALNKLGQRVQRSHGYKSETFYVSLFANKNSLLQPRVDGLGISQKTRWKGPSCWLSRNSREKARGSHWVSRTLAQKVCWKWRIRQDGKISR